MPFFLRQCLKAEKLHQVFAHHQIGEKRHDLAHAGQRSHCPVRAIDQITNTTHVNQQMIRRAIINTSCDLANHALALATACANVEAPP